MTDRQGKNESGRIKKKRQSNGKYKKLGIQEETGKETSGLICWSIFYQ